MGGKGSFGVGSVEVAVRWCFRFMRLSHDHFLKWHGHTFQPLGFLLFYNRDKRG